MRAEGALATDEMIARETKKILKTSMAKRERVEVMDRDFGLYIARLDAGRGIPAGGYPTHVR